VSDAPRSAADLFVRNADSDAIAAHFEDRSFTYRQLAGESLRRAALWDQYRDPSQPPHIGVLLDNTPEYLFWLGAAAITGSVVVGINATYRGEQLALLIDHCDCQVLVTSDAYDAVLADAPNGVPPDHVFATHTDEYAARLAGADDRAGRERDAPDPKAGYLLIFTSGSTGFPKAVRCTQRRFVRTGVGGAAIAQLGPGKAVYAPMPMFHSSALYTGLSTALAASVPFGTRSKFSASRAMPDIRRMGATLMAYTGKLLNYILATPPAPDDATSPLELALGNEASEADIRAFAQRFNCVVRDSYGSTEGMIIIMRDSSMPAGALGKPMGGDVAVYDPATGAECAAAQFDSDGRLTNADDAVGEIVNTNPGTTFEGYYHNDDALAAKLRDGVYWSGDLAYRDVDGWFYFAGRSNEWLRVDSENFAAAPVERIISRHPSVRSAAVYAVPDDKVGDRVMVALEVADPNAFDVHEFDTFLSAQRDMGTKWMPRFVRLSADLPKLASLKLDKTQLRRDAWRAPFTWWRPTREDALRRLSAADADALAHLLP
jgi:acyl-CoA synthetase (AMP-forming)/AMP-acid ligase II